MRGRLVVLPSGSGQFIFELWAGTGKENRQVLERWNSLPARASVPDAYDAEKRPARHRRELPRHPRERALVTVGRAQLEDPLASMLTSAAMRD
jgi:hypothetical protein